MISVDTVYQTVLALANKEQRGYITPQEFNLFANQAQMEIFDQYFYDINQFERRVEDDINKLIKSKIEFFKSASTSITHSTNLPNDVYFIDSVYLNMLNGKQVPVEKIDRDNNSNIWAAIMNSPLLKSNENRPTYAIIQNKILFEPQNGDYRINYTRKPLSPNWTYLIDSSNQNALYNSNATDLQDFELHVSEEPKLVIKILQLAGVSIKDFNLAQLAGQKEVSVKQQEKQ